MQVNTGTIIFKDTDCLGNERKIELSILHDAKVYSMKELIEATVNNTEKGSLVNRVIAADISRFQLEYKKDIKRDSIQFDEVDNDLYEVNKDKGYIYFIDLDAQTIKVTYEYNTEFEILYDGSINNFV
ncbi:hypothetical protein CRV02_13265 [Arcobacter sp. CECT 8989]|uniref:hypothetical protein n=1 Tax=Arcobacter sp. CECT 8989 TaxID=2044509 RepID=UPI00100BA071|nr:hypothetical protein [Arcobacter sp. CECT 8989]RXJ98457.1 hypothetical protein CRV02_13265 [Arcobacter sp. CECT 8989]